MIPHLEMALEVRERLGAALATNRRFAMAHGAE
jgi:hypothetical protein